MFCTVYKHHFTIHEGGPDEAVIGYDFSDFYTKVSTTEAYLCCIATAPEWASDLREFQLGAYNVLWDVQYVGEASCPRLLFRVIEEEEGYFAVFATRLRRILTSGESLSAHGNYSERSSLSPGALVFLLPARMTAEDHGVGFGVDENGVGRLNGSCKVFWLSFYDHPWLFPLLAGLDYQKLAVFKSYRVAQVIVLGMYDSNAYAVCNAEAKTLQTTIDAVLD
ncbi:hypothetical protein EV361DRAFT_869844 [Lentinula raphanica]|uniref:Uncharacterized protein n=1 Tax=Lentinula raphanica TaxID=153919 RepID=A0AA38UCJ2_9AGAR|nr:hypothetical protein F5880DRAFT_1503028 [Lentinula raphanica]KAJ3836896.1 hypothetical protein F5878DRAFT_643204 [Lentinula raphanica]KAJ3969744.1 hypothetical protein EV361DRAFT_869844 [Lentinula raphanica]